MANKPILFNTRMVQAIMEGHKTQTRRVCKGQGECNPVQCGYHPPFKPGDILWVRETWDNVPVSPGGHFRFVGRYYYKADGDLRPDSWRGNWHPSIHMPKEAARIFLRVKDVRVERLRDIGNADAIAEGFSGTPCHHENADPALGCTDCLNTGWLEPPCAEFAQLWDSTIKPADLDKYGWDANPWVWVIEFERCERPEGWH